MIQFKFLLDFIFKINKEAYVLNTKETDEADKIYKRNI